MGSSRLAPLLLPLLLLFSRSVSAEVGCPYLPHWTSRCLLASYVDKSFAGLQWGWFPLLVKKSKRPHKFEFYWRRRTPASSQRKLLGSLSPSLEGQHISNPFPAISRKEPRSKRTQPPSDAEGVAHLPGAGSQKCGGPEFSFDLLPEAQAIRVTIPPGPEASVRLCYQWALECEDMSSPFDTQKIVPGGHTADLPYEFLLPCMCIEASYLQEDTVRRKKCPFQSWPETYGSDFWKSVHFTDYSRHDQMVMALTLRCPLKLEASLCQRQDPLMPCETLPNATAQESEGWYVLENVDLHPQLCFKFSFENSSHIECPHQSGSLPSWTVSMTTQGQQLTLHFSSGTYATFSAAWSTPGLELDTLMPTVYSVSQTQGSVPATLDLIIPFLRPGSCILVWRSDVQFAWKHLLCPDVSHRHLGLLILALLGLATLLGIVLSLLCRRLLPGPGQARPILLLHAADSEAQRRLVGALAELLRTALGGGRDVIVDLWEGTHVARIGPLPWLWAARERVAREQGTVLLLWNCAGPSPAGSSGDPHTASLRTLFCAAPSRLLLAYFSRLCAKGDIPRPLRTLPRYRLLRDLPRLLRALDARPATLATSWSHLGAKRCLKNRLELCHRLELAAKVDHQGSADHPCGSSCL
ncbi:LOW QUALITY PROTEIN: interleukin-17 receptor E [Peromyscus californicus insignis]|uniref:LOW QUALITY PROTEIN: interleukin-17 receptor E n=1 Tax=Peromyscus californicus insignis TaxID=564181 RepID=UPI0022A7FF1A|nr:LOW QUALITY PROTEIN: interleukin-17 receptor E [Peromyscus californicus insignis]